MNHPRMAHAIRGYKNQKRIMKKEYIKPEIAVEEFISEIYMESSSFIEGEGGEGGDGDFGAPGRRPGRGTWGNLWASED